MRAHKAAITVHDKTLKHEFPASSNPFAALGAASSGASKNPATTRSAATAKSASS